MPTKNDQDTQTIKDANRALLGALDRLLTIGSYYQPSHERFQAVARQCVQALENACDGRPMLEIFVTTDAVIVDKGTLPAGEPEAKRLFDLLDPMHIALVEIDAQATSDHLHLALISLKKARNSITSSRSYKEIEIIGLPDTVRAINRSLFLKTKVEEKPRPKPPPKKETTEVNFFQHNVISDLLLSGDVEAQKLEKEFLGIIKGIMATVDPTKLKNEGNNEEPDQWLPEETIDSIKRVLEALSGTGSDLMNLQHLIAQAQTALEMTGDPQLVDLVFSRLQKDSRKLARKRVQPKMIGKDQKSARTNSRHKLIMSLEEMREIYNHLEVPLGPMPDPVPRSNADCLSICIQLMDLAPSEELVTGIEETIMRMVSTTELTVAMRDGIIRVSRALLLECPNETLDRTWPMVWGPLRRSHPEELSPLWYRLWQDLPSRGRDRAWALLVNDLLMGMITPDRIGHILLLEALSQIDALGDHDIRVMLENLPAMLEGHIAPDFFDAPAPLLYPVHKVLVGCSNSRAFGPRLHDNLVKQVPHRLSANLLEIMDSYQPINRAVYHAILDQGIEEAVHPDLADLAPEIIQDALQDLHWDFMEEDWVLESIGWLSQLGHESAIPILEEITIEKKYMVLNSWPLAAREAARDALKILKERLDYKGRQEEEPEGPAPAPEEAPLEEAPH